MNAYRRVRTDIRALVRNLGVLQARYAELDLGVSQCHALLELAERELSVGELAARLKIEISTASRNLDTLERHGLITSRRAADDPRRKLHRLSPKGRARVKAIDARGDRVVRDAFALLTPAERATVTAGLESFARALERSELADVTIRPSVRADNPAIARVIRAVLEELGQARPGTAYHEATTDEIHDVYRRANGLYLVVERDGEVHGGGGIFPHGAGVCELKNMYFVREVRGGGHAKRLVNELLAFARERGFGEVFLETFSGWEAAIALYRSFGFEPAKPPPFYRGHSLCDRHFRLLLSPSATSP